MFGASDMMADMLKKLLPPEVLAMLTPEKINEIGEKANAFVTDIRGSLDYIKAQNVTTHELQNAILAKVEALENGGRSSQRRGGKSGERGGTPSGDSSGDANGSGSDNG